jgi:hypothetical protein
MMEWEIESTKFDSSISTTASVVFNKSHTHSPCDEDMQVVGKSWRRKGFNQKSKKDSCV